MAEPKTKPNDASVEAFMTSIKDAERQKDARTLLRLMRRATGQKPKMWGTSIVGFGQIHWRYASGREGDWFITGFSPRAQNLTVYLMAGFGKLKTKLAKLGKHSTGASCLYLPRLADIDCDVLASILDQAIKEAKALERPAKANVPEVKKSSADRKSSAVGRA